jgi:two-component system, OmpR family, response regulator VicR
MSVMPISTMKTPLPTGLDLDRLDPSNPRRRVMIIDDEPETVGLIKYVLSNAGIDVAGAESGQSAIDKVPRIWPDLILLDLMMPEMDGMETFANIRKLTPAPVVIVSAKNQKDDIVKGLQMGADDYITKPFHPAELVARVNTVVNRSRQVSPASGAIEFPSLEMRLDPDTREVEIRGKLVALARREFNVLHCLGRHSPRWVDHSTLAEEVWGQNDPKAVNRIKYVIYLLRRKLEQNPSHPQLILAREGLGYKLATDRNKP